MIFSVRLLIAGSLFSAATMATATVGHPAIYATELLEEKEVTCSEDQRITLINDESQVLANLCPRQYKKCVWMGSCILKKLAGTRETFSYTRYNPRLERETFRKINDGCIYGQGAGFDAKKTRVKTCLDPYFSVAVDPKEHLVGEVLFVPKLIGLVLPTGEVHDGYVIARDGGKDTDDRGPDYISFYAGIENVNSSSNPFVRMMLDNIDYVFDYQTVSEETAVRVRTNRNYPNLPAQLQEFYR